MKKTKSSASVVLTMTPDTAAPCYWSSVQDPDMPADNELSSDIHSQESVSKIFPCDQYLDLTSLLYDQIQIWVFDLSSYYYTLNSQVTPACWRKGRAAWPASNSTVLSSMPWDHKIGVCICKIWRLRYPKNSDR